MTRNLFQLGSAALLALSAAAFIGLRAQSAPVALTTSIAQDAQGGADVAADLVKKIKKDEDRANPDLIKQLAALKTRPALDGLLEIYDAMKTIFMQREVVRTLPEFDGVADTEQPALQKLTDIATNSSEQELRESALDALGRCPTHGKDFLRMIVVSPAEDAVREQALKLHVKLATKDDEAWYHELYKPKVDEQEKKAEKEARKKAEKEEREKAKLKAKANKNPKDKDKEKDKPEEDDAAKSGKGTILDSMRLIAFGALRTSLSIDDLVAATKDPFTRIHGVALEEMAARGDKKALDVANDILNHPKPPPSKDPNLPPEDELPENRVIAARVIAKIQGVKAAAEFIKRAISIDTPVELRRGLAEILVGFNDPGVNHELLGGLLNPPPSGHMTEKLFHIYAVRSMQDEHVDKALLKMLQDKEKPIVIAAIKILGERKSKEAQAALKRLFEKDKDRDVIHAALDATAMIRQGDPTWIDELVALTKSEDPDVRNLALEQLGNSSDRSHLDRLVTALDDKNWSTRLAALDALERMKTREAISAIVVHMQKEEGRMLEEFANTLWRLTGQPYHDNAEGWNNWWKQNGANFQILSDADLEKVRSGEEEWRLRQTTRVKSTFFGIRIISHRVIFIIDVSGSMDWPLSGEYKGKPVAHRIETAKSELERCIKGLDQSALFNIIPFSTGVDHWGDGSLAAANEKNRESALAYVDKLKPGGGTNLYGAIKEAFSDKDVDTIFIMSDGEPNYGDIVEPLQIREAVKAMNEHRKIVINTIAVAGQFDILAWLAEDSGGTHVKFE